MEQPEEPMPLHRLNVTQEAVRNPQQLRELVQFVQAGGTFTGICVFGFPDQQMFLHDGHHRVLAVFLAGREQLLPSEYVVIRSTYEDINSVFFEKCFVTPYDPRKEVRLGNFGDFKQTALELFRQGKEAEARQYIAEQRSTYSALRTMNTIAELAALLSSPQ